MLPHAHRLWDLRQRQQIATSNAGHNMDSQVPQPQLQHGRLCDRHEIEIVGAQTILDPCVNLCASLEALLDS